MQVKTFLVGISTLMSSFFFLQSCYFESQAPTNVKEKGAWLSLEEAISVSQKSEQFILVDVYTDWCKWCKVMDEKTFSDPSIKSYLADNFHLSKFNAEQRTPIKFNGKSYEYVKGQRRGYNQLAAHLLKGQLSYPSFVILNHELEVVKSFRGFKTPDQLMSLLSELG